MTTKGIAILKFNQEDSDRTFKRQSDHNFKFNQQDDSDHTPKSSGAIVTGEVSKSGMTKVIISGIKRIKRDN